MEFKVLGPVEVTDGFLAVPVTSPKQRRLLAALLVQANEVVATDRLAELVWRDDERPSRAAGAVQTYVARLRSLLGGGDTLATVGTGYLLRVPPHELDAARFEALVDEARRHGSDDPTGACAALDDALGLWRGPAYGELAHEGFVQPAAVRLDELRLVALEDRADARLAMGGHEAVVGELEALVADHPLRERLRGQLMVALYRSGRHPEALRAYHDHRRRLGEELGLEPAPPLRELEERILRHDPGLAPPAPAARSRPRRPATVTRKATSFVGREGVVTALIEELGRSRLVTLTGPGGVGKSRLASEVATEARPGFAEGAVLCPLAPVADPAAVVSVLATTLGVALRRERTVEEALVEFLRSRHLLLVVDNCEHVLDAAAGLVERLLLDSEHLAILATSRERLAVPGERVWSVPPLPVPQAGVEAHTGVASVALFCDRARAVRPGVISGGDNLARIAEICRRLDGVPLAIELAAARVGSMNVADVAGRLEARFRLLSNGARTTEPRHRSLRAVVDWSYELLDDGERRLFDRLSVFAGGFTLAAVEDVCAGDGVERGEVVELMGGLVDKSMVTIGAADDLARYSLLETLRHYGRERLEATGARQAWLKSHDRHYVSFAEQAAVQLASQDESRWVLRIRQELDNLREVHHRAIAAGDVDTALRLSAALATFAWHQLTLELFSWAEAAAELSEGSGNPLVPLVLGSAALGAWRRDLDLAASLASQALAAAADPDDPAARTAWYVLGAVALSTGRLDDAVEHLRRSRAFADQVGDRDRAVMCLAVEALALTYRGDVDSGIERAEEALAVARDLGAPSLISWSLYAKGEVLLEDQPERALLLLDESRVLAHEVTEFVFGVASVSAATLRARLGDPAESLGELHDLLEHWRRVGVWTTQWTTLRNLIDVFVRLGIDEPAAVLHGALLATATAAPVFGVDARRLAAAMGILEERVPGSKMAAWTERGRRLGDEEAVDYARAQIEQVVNSGAPPAQGLR